MARIGRRSTARGNTAYFLATVMVLPFRARRVRKSFYVRLCRDTFCRNISGLTHSITDIRSHLYFARDVPATWKQESAAARSRVNLRTLLREAARQRRLRAVYQQSHRGWKKGLRSCGAGKRSAALTRCQTPERRRSLSGRPTTAPAS